MSLKAFLIKLIGVAGVSAILIPMLTDIGFNRALTFGLTLAVISYILGDWLILNYMGNMVATLADAGLAAVALRYYGAGTPNIGVSWGDALIYGAVVAVFEYFFHNYLNRTEKAHKAIKTTGDRDRDRDRER